MDYDFSLPEHPEDTKLRLRLDGKYVEAMKVKTAVYQRNRSRLRVNSREMTHEELAICHHRGWQKVLEKYPPPDKTSPCDGEDFTRWFEKICTSHRTNYHKLPTSLPRLSDEAIERFEKIGPSTSLLTDVGWVGHVLNDSKVDPLSCPNRSAWNLLGQARKDRPWFYQNHYKPAVAMMQKQNLSEEGNQISATEKRAREEIREMIRVAREECLGEG